MDAQTWAIVIGVVGSLLLQILGRLQAWHLAVIAARTEAKTEATHEHVVDKVGAVQRSIDGNQGRLIADMEKLAEANAALREQLSGFIERDASTAQLARVIPPKG